MSLLVDAVNRWKNNNDEIEDDRLRICLIKELRRVIDHYSPDEFYSKALDRFSKLDDVVVRVYGRNHSDGDWRFKSLEFESGEFAIFVAVPSRSIERERLEDGHAPPTAAVDALILAILREPELFENELAASCVISITRTGTLSIEAEDFAWIACSLGATHHRGLPRACWLNDKTQMSGDRLRFEVNQTMFKIMASAYGASQVEYRFLGFYRVLEARLRRNVLDDIQRNFLLNPAATLQKASELLKAERKQLKAVVEQYSLENFFEEVADAWKSLSKNNRFATLIGQKIELVENPTGKFEKYAKGVAIVYQCRCAIVHTADGIIYEQFDDADEAIEGITPYIEQAALSCIGVSPI